ncbi:MAG: amidohydrolase family protein, partial [Flavobacteriaceae bacterium]
TALDHHAEMLGNSKAALIPTYSLWYPSFPFAKNPWENPAANAISPDSIHLPVDKKTGKWSALKNTEQWDTLVWSKMLVKNLLQIEKKYVQKGAKYLTGSGTDAFGSMPGISLHSELEMLHRAGLTNRQALAAATTNFCKVWGWDHIGQIKPGSEADLLILSRNPVENLSHLKEIDLLLLDGKILKPDSLVSEVE